jgi:hypothetical protein
MSQDGIRLINSTISRYIKGQTVNILRNKKLPALLKSKGRFTFNWDGLDMVWRVKVRRAPMQGFADNDTLNFQKRERTRTATLPYRGYSLTDQITKFERLKNRGNSQIINLFSEMVENLMKDADEAFGQEFYSDGNLSANAKKMHGLESFLGAGSAQGDFCRAPSDTFANLSTVLGALGGVWTGTWPSGYGDTQYDAWSPTLVDYSGAGWEADVKEWANTCTEALRYAIIKTNKNKSMQGRIDMFMVTDDMYREFLNKLDEKQRIQVQSNSSNSTLIKLGFTDVTNWDGCDITYEYGVPADTGYGINCDEMEVRSMQSRLWESDGPTWDQAARAWRLVIDFMGNTVWNPRHFAKLKNFT